MGATAEARRRRIIPPAKRGGRQEEQREFIARHNTNRQYRARASVVALAWKNAAIAASQHPAREVLYRTLSVEFFKNGIQMIGCDGSMLFRTWAPLSDVGDLPAEMPDYMKRPLDSVVVMDHDKFALGFMSALLSASGGEDDLPYEISFSIEESHDEEEPALGSSLGEYVLTLQAVGQRLSCKLFDGPYPDWRSLQFGLDAGERVDGMVLGTKLFRAVGKLKGVSALELSFRGEERAIEFVDKLGSIRGLLMPMRREKEKPAAQADDDDQLEHDE